MQRSRLSRHRSVRPKVAEKEPAGIAIAPSVASGARDAATGGACAQERIQPAKVGREALDGVARGDGRAGRGAHSPERGAIAGQPPDRAGQAHGRERLEELVETLLPNEPAYI